MQIDSLSTLVLLFEEAFSYGAVVVMMKPQPRRKKLEDPTTIRDNDRCGEYGCMLFCWWATNQFDQIAALDPYVRKREPMHERFQTVVDQQRTRERVCACERFPFMNVAAGKCFA